MKWFQKILHLFYPELCLGCGHHQPLQGGFLCPSCQIALVPVQPDSMMENPCARHFWGRIPIGGACSAFQFRKGNPIQQLMYHLKYQGRQDVGFWLGREIGRMLRTFPENGSIDLVVPVPLHRKKLRLRGYNQATCIAKGISEVLGVPVSEKVLHRVVHTSSQTRKDRGERLDNMRQAFGCKPRSLEGIRHVLLVDDVLTTGATLEACALALIGERSVKISIATAAMADS